MRCGRRKTRVQEKLDAKRNSLEEMHVYGFHGLKTLVTKTLEWAFSFAKEFKMKASTDPSPIDGRASWAVVPLVPAFRVFYRLLSGVCSPRSAGSE